MPPPRMHSCGASLLVLALLAGACSGLPRSGGSPGAELPAGPGHRLVPPPTPAESAAAAETLRAIERLPIDDFAAHSFTGSGGSTLPFRLLPPLRAEPGRRYPLVAVFHGSGEIGTDNLRQMDRLPRSWAREEIRRAYPAYVLVPQMPERSALYTGPAGEPDRRSSPGPPLHAALELIDSLAAALPVDRERVYAVGFSMGASTVWNMLNLRPDLFAAAVPVGGVPNPEHARQVARTPVWIVHGNRDDANPVAQDRAMFDLLRSLGAPAAFWEFDGMGHQVPPAFLAGDHFPRWLFRHRKPQ